MTRKAVLLALSCLLALAMLAILVKVASSDEPVDPRNYKVSTYHYVPVSLTREEKDTVPIYPHGLPMDFPWTSHGLPRATPELPQASASVLSAVLSSVTVQAAKDWALWKLGPAEYLCLASIIKHEDGTWDPYRTNPSSGAYGIPQALPGSKMAWAGSDWRTNRITQVKWMIHYVNVRYGSACDAWAFWRAHSWY